MITLGVEEEYLLVDPVTAAPAPMVEKVRRAAHLGPFADGDEIQYELLQAQIEVATPVCWTLDEVGGHLLRLRHALASAAEASGCRIAATGAAPVLGGLPVPVTPIPRYMTMAGDARRLVDEQLICGMHVHVGVPDPETGVAVLNRIRGWLPVLLAMSANSPLWDGRDTGFASWRTVVFGRWPVSGPAPHFDGFGDYEERLEALVASEVIADRGQIYWQARLSDRYPTVEVRCLDVQLRADDAVMFAGVIRALVVTAIAEEKAGLCLPVLAPELVQAATWRAARHGLNGTLPDSLGRPRGSDDALEALLRHITPALEDAGDLRVVSGLLHRLRQVGTPADRQHRALREAGLPALIDLLSGSGTSA
ncbi:glutamate--cysteine ligase [Streptomyces sp. NPDC056374]|uniref:carboxylate-amine ligase n=1 Tax=unclassified Streptomyces TaxID=2593676 RepID=UPI0035E288EF